MKLLKVFLFALIGFAFVAHGASLTDADYGWKSVIDKNGKITGLSNIGEQGGLLKVTCNADTHRLKVTYSFGKQEYDMFVFRKFGVVDMKQPGSDGKFFYGTGMTTQAVVYFNVLTADKAFTIARFPIGSKVIWDNAIKNKAANAPEIKQEGDENFLAGEGWKATLRSMSTDCPFNANDEDGIF